MEEQSQKGTVNRYALAKMALGGVGMGITAGTVLYGLLGGSHIIRADMKAFSRFNRSLVGDYYCPFTTESGAFTLSSPFTSFLLFPYFLSTFQRGYDDYYTKSEALQNNNLKMRAMVSKGLECCKIGISFINFLPALAILGESISFDEDGWNPKRVGLEALFAFSAVGHSVDTIADSFARITNRSSKNSETTQQKSSIQKLWLLTQIATGCIGTAYGAEGMHQSVIHDMFKKHGLLYSIPALGITTVYTLLSAHLAYKGWSKI